MNVDLTVRAREDVPAWLVYASPVFTVVAALAVGSFALVGLAVDPVQAYTVMFVDTLTSEFGLRETAIKAVPLILTGLGVYLPLRAGLWNIGAEGQLIIGALAGTWLGLNLSLPGPALLVVMFLGAGLVGAVWAGVPGWLRARWGINEIITTLLLTFVALNLKEYLLRGPMRGGVGNFPQTELLPTAATLPNLLGTGVHAGILPALLLVAVTYVIVNNTRLGFEITFVGSNDEAAVQAGMSTFRVYVLVFLGGGAVAAMAGIADISGVQGRLLASYEPGYGFTAIVIALLGRNSAIKVMAAALFFAVLFVGGSSMAVSMSVPSALVEVIQALIILFLITAEFFKRYRVEIDVDRGTESAPPGRPDPGGDA